MSGCTFTSPDGRRVWLPGPRVPLDRNAAERVWAAGSCTKVDDPEAFFPAPGDQAGSRAARAICATCPVQVECLTTFGPLVPHGVLAGLTAHDRRTWRATGDPDTRRTA